MRVLMTCGGTGGHINPAVAIANTIKNNIADAEILFVGTKHGKEKDLIPREGYEICFVESEGIRRSLSPANIRALWKALISPYKAKKIIRDFAPDIVIGTGGYACWPVLRAAGMMGVPSAVHESNAIPGMAVKRLEKHIDRIFTNFERTGDFLTEKEKVMRVGNPLRTAFSGISKAEAREKLGIPASEKYLLSYGGSGGAEFVNQTVLEMMRDYAAANPDIRMFHACGARDAEATMAKFREYGLDKLPNVSVVEYIFDMPLRMAAADVVICRAGAMTVSELSMMGKASVMIPSPNVVDNHQYKNAAVLAEKGATTLLEEAGMTASNLFDAVKHLLDDTAARTDMENAIRPFADLDANRLILDEILRMTQR